MSDEFDKVRDAFITLLEAIALAIVLVFIIMVAQFESFLLPFVIMFSMPFAVIGVYWGLFITGNTMNVLSGAGMLLLAGIVVNNAIVLVDHINNLRKKGLNKTESLIKATSDRLRPIMMTGATTLVGLFPMALGANDQGRLIYSPLAIAVLGGIFTSTMLVPILIPVIYSYSDDAVETIKQKLTKIYLAFVS
jgi:HAE1 family hydrophobic/amphiphilic exporter-1